MSDVTPEVLRPSTARRAAIFVAGVVVFFLLLNFGARWYLQNHGTNLGYRIVHAKWALLEELDAPVDWLVFGDSSGCHGIVPEALGEVLGGSAVNLATLANLLLVDDAWMLQRYIERFGPPKNVVLVHAFDVWHRGYNSALIGQIPQRWGFWEDTAPTIDFTADQKRRLFLSRFVPLYAENATLRDHLRHFGPPKDVPFSITATGWVPGQPHHAGRLAGDLARTRRFLEEQTQFRVSNLNAAAIEVIGKLSDQHGFPVYLVNGPLYDALAETPAFARYRRQKEARIERMVSKYPNFHAIDTLPTYPRASMEVYVDHVIPEVAPVYTRTIAEAIKAWRVKHPPPVTQVVEPPAKPAWPPKVAGTFAPGKERVRLVFGGDASLARGIADTIALDGGDPAKTLAGVAPAMSAADLAFVNLECVLSESAAEAADRRWLIRADPALAPGLAAIGIDVVSTANNHTRDFGRQGYHRTLAALDAAGILHTGAVWDDEAQPPLVVQVGRYRVGFVAYTDITRYGPREAAADLWPMPANYDVGRVVRDVERLRPEVDVLVVSLHWGHEYSMLETDEQRAQARRFVDAGADLIIGHHPHVPRVVERYGKGLIAYSLGDFIFDKNTPFKRIRNRRRFLLEVEWGPEGLAGHRLLPINADDRHRPYPDPALDVASFEYRPSETPFAFSRSTRALAVERVSGEAVTRCGRWQAAGPNRKGSNGYQQWLRDRWVCPDDAARPWLTVATSAHRAGTVFRKGLWAHPHPGGPLRITAPAVPLGQALVGFAGVPDWPQVLAGADAPPVTVRVAIDGEPVFEQAVPVAGGWTPLAVETARFAGQTRPVTVEIEGGPAREFGFVFDFKVDPEPVSFN